MKHLHAKSPCCRATVQRFGQRRRRCIQCHKTWRIRQKKRGRKQCRVNAQFVVSYLTKSLPPLRILARKRSQSKSSLQRQLHRSLAQYIRMRQSQWVHELSGTEQLIAIVDAIWYHVGEEFHTIYTILLRPISATAAVICPPIVIQGREDLQGWQQAIQTLPESLQQRISVLVCDGATSLVWLSRHRHWILQRCHFHLIAAVQNYLTTGPRSMHQDYAVSVLRTVQKFLKTNNPTTVQQLRSILDRVHDQSHSRGLRRVLRGFLATYRDYHTYLLYPELHLPTTSNAAESWIQCIRDLMYRTRGFRSKQKLEQWIRALAFEKKIIRCNGTSSTKLTD